MENNNETVINQGEKEEKKMGLIDKIASSFKSKESPFTAETCFIQSKYGEGSYKPLVQRIADKQNHIKSVISTKFAPGTNAQHQLNYSSFHCVIDIEEDLLNSVDEIFKPFIESGFEIINLSDECKSIQEDGIYLVSWLNAFKKHQKK